MDSSLLLPYGKLLFVFACMLAGIRCKLGLGLSVLAGSLLLSLFFGAGFTGWVSAAAGIFSDTVILTVWGVCVMVLALSSLMESSGQAERFMGALSHRVKSPAARLVFFPILIGLLPMPGGAVFSAPMINAVTKNLDVPEVDKANINYWFRHVAELSWPLYPAVILAASFAGISTPRIGIWTLPMTFAFFGAGWLFLMRPLHMPTESVIPADAPDGSWGNILKQGAPIFIALGGALGIEVLIALFFPACPLDYGILFALVAALACCLVQNGYGPVQFFRTVTKPHVMRMIFMVGALGVFKNVLTGGGVVEQLLAAGSGHTAIWLLATGLSLVVGLLTGILMAVVGAVGPLLIALSDAAYGPGHALPWLVMCMVSGAAGYMISPLHICFVLSCQYFRVDMVKAWRRIPKPAIAYWFVGLAYFGFLRLVFG